VTLQYCIISALLTEIFKDNNKKKNCTIPVESQNSLIVHVKHACLLCWNSLL